MYISYDKSNLTVEVSDVYFYLLTSQPFRFWLWQNMVWSQIDISFTVNHNDIEFSFATSDKVWQYDSINEDYTWV